VKITNAGTGYTSAPTVAFSGTIDLTLTYGSGPGSVFEKYRGLSLTPTGPDFIETRVGTPANPVSNLVTVQPAGSTYPTSFPTLPATSFAAAPSAGTIFSASDFINAFATDGPLDKLEIFNLLVLPGVTNSGVLSAASAFAERKMAFLIIDPPIDRTADGANSVDQVPISGLVAAREKLCPLFPLHPIDRSRDWERNRPASLRHRRRHLRPDRSQPRRLEGPRRP